jgi:ElaB/YqjD/DUF883 family membrane-anchored ribosome-binding protein
MLPSFNDLNRAIHILEGHIEQLTSSDEIRAIFGGAGKRVRKVATRTSGPVGEVVADRLGEAVAGGLSEVGTRLQGRATAVTGAARTAVDAMQQVGAQLERQPLMTIAIALGIGFLAMTSSRSDSAG